MTADVRPRAAGTGGGDHPDSDHAGLTAVIAGLVTEQGVRGDADVALDGRVIAIEADYLTSVAADAAYDTLGAAAAAQAAAIAASQPVDDDLTAIALLGTTAYGRAFLILADDAAARTALALGTAATSNVGDFDAAGAAAAAQAASQPLDSDLTAISLLSTTSFGRSLLALVDASAGRTALELGGSATLAVGTTAGTVAAGDDSRIVGAAQKASNLSDLTNAGTARTNLGIGTAATSAASDFEAVAGHTSNSIPAASGSTSLVDLAMGASTILARLAAGNIVAATPAQLKTLLAIAESDVTNLVTDLAGKASTAHATTHQPGGSDAMAVDAAAATGSLRTLGPGATQALPGNTTVGRVTGRGIKSTFYIAPQATSGAVGTLASPNGTAFYSLIDIERAITVDRIGIEITTLAASSAVRLGIYTDVNGQPDTKVLDAGTVDSTTTGVKEITISQALAAGRYWLVAVAQGGSPTIRSQRTDIASHTSASTLSGFAIGGYQQTSVSGALPTTATPISGGEFSGRVLLRVV